VKDFEDIYAELLVVGVDEDVARQAGELAQRLRLRGYDAVQLASALTLGLGTTVITWDADLSAAAHETGLAVAPAT
jgi:predicted nucleic acid-binding protein